MDGCSKVVDFSLGARKSGKAYTKCLLRVWSEYGFAVTAVPQVKRVQTVDLEVKNYILLLSVYGEAISYEFLSNKETFPRQFL